MEGKKGGKRLWSIAASVFMCLTLCACKAEGEMENVSGADIRQGQDVDFGEGGENSGIRKGEPSEEPFGSKEEEGVEGISDTEKGAGTEETPEIEEDKTIGLSHNTEQTPQNPLQKTPEEILAEQLIDETHDAFLIEKGGKTGTVLVTAERQLPYTFLEFSVWDLDDMEKPIQVITSGGGYDEFGKYMIVDANFDGWVDFGYLRSVHDGREYWDFWYWNERESQFEERYLGFYLMNPVFSADTKIVSCLDEEHGSGSFHRWQNGSIYDVRSITTTDEEDRVCLTVTDYFGDVPVLVFSQNYVKDSAEWREQWKLWCDLDYHGEPGSAGDLLQNGIPEDTISAFVLRVGSEEKEMFVTAQPCDVAEVMDAEGAQCWYRDYAVRFSVWNPNDMSEPIQSMCKYVEQYHYQKAYSARYEIVDANFDGYMDFSWVCHSGNQPMFHYLWLWDEEQGKFVEEPAYNKISAPMVDAGKEIIYGWSRNSAADDGSSTFYKWIDGELLCMRHIFVLNEIDRDDFTMTVEDRIGGEMVEVYRAQFQSPWDFDAERDKWENLDYHGEE